MPYFYYDSTMLLLIPAMLISFFAQSRINSIYNKYSKIRTMNGYSGQQIARMILDGAGLLDVRIEQIDSKLGDHYDPSSKILRLSKEVYTGASISAAGIAAHEVGHAIQHKESYKPLIIRNTIVPVVNISTNISWMLFFLGVLMKVRGLTTFGIVLFSAVVIFQLITLPVEFNASNKALKILKGRTILYEEEVRGAKKVLNAAAMTYVAATLMAISQLIRLIAIGNRSRED